MPSVFKIYVLGISEQNLVWRSDQVTETTGYGGSILSPKLKKEVNKADGFDFMILPSNDFYDSFEKKKTFVFLTRDDKCIFRGRVSDVKTDIFKQRTVTCEGDLAFLADSVQSPNKKTDTSDAGDTEKKKRTTLYYSFNGSSSTSEDVIKMSVETYFRGLIGEHNSQMSRYSKSFAIGEVTVTDKNNVEKFERTSYQDTSSVISSDLLSIHGGVLRTRYENNTAYIDWLNDYTETSEQVVRFGVNLIEMDQEAPSDSVWSVLLPVGEENVTIADVNRGSIYLSSDELIEKYGYIVHYHQFNDVKKPYDLKFKADQYMRLHGRLYPDNIIVKAIDLQLIGESNDPLELGEKIRVVSEPHDVDDIMSCIAMELDILNPENNSYTIGMIMPPDKEKKKDSLSSQHASSSSSHSRGIGNNANKIGSMNEDINVNANNINVNAKNIAVNALNIAVNAENIAVVAKNIAIAAETIDIRAQQITAEFGTEVDDLHGYIESSAEGIKTAFSDNTTGLSSYFSQKAGEISAGIESADGNIRSKLTLTEQNLTTEFNKKLYGPSQDGTGGIVADYSSKITQSATNLTSQFNMKLYGTNGTLENPTGGVVSDYRSKISQSASDLTTEFNKKLYGSGGSMSDPKDGSIVADYKSKINQSATSIRSEVSTTLYGSGGTNASPTGGIVQEYRSSITQLSGEITLRVKKGDIASTINQTAQSVRISASKIDLDGYVTVDDLSATNAKIANLVSGTEFATSLGVTGSIEIGNYGTAAKLNYRGSEYYPVSMSSTGMDSVICLGRTSSGYASASLNHSHSVTVYDTGTIVLGGTVGVNNGGSFRIADTKTYQDGVSAARTEGINSVSVDSVSLNTTDYYNGIGDSAYDGYAIYYDSSYRDYHVRIRADASNGSHRESRIDFSGDKAYNSGYNSGYSDGVVKGREGVTVTGVYINSVDASADNNDGVYDCANIELTIYLNSGGSKSWTLSNVSMWKVYNSGAIDAIEDASYCDGVTLGSDGTAHVTIAASLIPRDGGSYRTYKHYVSTTNVTDYHN